MIKNLILLNPASGFTDRLIYEKASYESNCFHTRLFFSFGQIIEHQDSDVRTSVFRILSISILVYYVILYVSNIHF